MVAPPHRLNYSNSILIATCGEQVPWCSSECSSRFICSIGGSESGVHSGSWGRPQLRASRQMRASMWSTFGRVYLRMWASWSERERPEGCGRGLEYD